MSNTRRTFIKKAGTISTGICCGLSSTILLNSCSSVKYISAKKESNKLKVPKLSLGEHQFAVIQYDGLPAPVYLNVTTQQAFLMLCTHKNCELQPTGSFMTCPCHGSEFSNKGKVLNPPADTNLNEYHTTSDNEFIYIHLKS